MATLVTVGRTTRNRLRLGKTSIAKIEDGGTVVDLDDAEITRDMHRWGGRWVVMTGEGATAVPSAGTSTVVAGAEAANVVNVAIQLKDAQGRNIAAVKTVDAYVSDSATGVGVAATAPTTVAIGTDGELQSIVTGKVFKLTSAADGAIDVDFTDAGADTWYLVLVDAAGDRVVSNAITVA